MRANQKSGSENGLEERSRNSGVSVPGDADILFTIGAFVETRRQSFIGGERLIDGDFGNLAAGWLQEFVRDAPGMPALGAGVAEEADDRLAQSGGQMHGAAIGADDSVAMRESGDQFVEPMRRYGKQRNVAA